MCQTPASTGATWSPRGSRPGSAAARRGSWGHSSAGRALEWHSRGRRFDPAWLHQPPGSSARLSGLSDFSRHSRGLDAPFGIGELARRGSARSAPPLGRPFSTREVECPGHDGRDRFDLRGDWFDLSAGAGRGHERRRGLVGPASLRSTSGAEVYVLLCGQGGSDAEQRALLGPDHRQIPHDLGCADGGGQSPVDDGLDDRGVEGSRKASCIIMRMLRALLRSRIAMPSTLPMRPVLRSSSQAGALTIALIRRSRWACC